MDNVASKPFSNSLKAGWNILHHELLFITWALMEVALITPLFLAYTPWTTFWSPATVATWLLLLMLIPFNLSRLTSVLRFSVQRQQIIMAAALFVLVLMAWRLMIYSPGGLFKTDWLATIIGHLGNTVDPRWTRELALFVIIGLMWWRGIALAGRGVDYRDIGLRMRLGILFAVFFVAGLAGSQLAWSVTPFILLFFFTSLVSIDLTRAEQLELGRSGRSFPVAPSWLLSIVMVAAAVVFVTGMIAGMVSDESIGRVVGWFEPLWLAISFTLATIVSIVSLIASPLLLLLVAFFELVFSILGPGLRARLENVQLEIPVFPAVSVDEAAQSSELFTPEYTRVLTGLIMVSVILLVALALRGLFRMTRPPADLQRDTVNPFEGLGRPARPGLGRRLLDRLNLFRRWQKAASIRHVYREMCSAAAEKGYPRSKSETPIEYLATLAEAWPDNETEAELITQAYNDAHYGELPESDEELQHILDAWERLTAVDSSQK
jgi:hypothetical protein